MILKPYYIFKSGGLQVSDMCLVVVFIIILLKPSLKKEYNWIQKKNIKNFQIYILFLVCVSLINIVYFCEYRNSDFILSTLYYIFIFIGMYIFNFVFDNKVVMEKMLTILKVNIIIQFIIYILGIGRYYSGIRYMGTFNDPNQFAFYIFISIILIYVINIILGKKKIPILINILGIYLIGMSLSTGILVGTIIYLIAINFNTIINFIKKPNSKSILFIVISALLVVVVVVNIWGDSKEGGKFSDIIIDSEIYGRILEKFNKVSGEANMNIFEDRGMDKLYIYPEYIVYGAGQGEYERYVEAFSQNEIHSTLPSILFYYGIIPFCILMIWIYLNIKNSNIEIKLICFSVLVESFFLLNQRQLYLWILILLVNYIKEVRKKEKDDEKNF